MERSLESGGETTAADKDSGAQAPKAKRRRKRRGERTLEVVHKCLSAHLRLGARACKEEPQPPSAPGTYYRRVNTVDGSIEYVKVKYQVSRPVRPELPPSHYIQLLFYITVILECPAVYLVPVLYSSELI